MRRCALLTCFVLFVGILAHRHASSSMDTWTSRGLQGKIWALALDPSNPNVLYASQLEGIFKSTDAGHGMIRAVSEVNLRTDDHASCPRGCGYSTTIKERVL